LRSGADGSAIRLAVLAMSGLMVIRSLRTDRIVDMTQGVAANHFDGDEASGPETGAHDLPLTSRRRCPGSVAGLLPDDPVPTRPPMPLPPLIALSLGYFLVMLDVTVVNVGRARHP